MTEEKKPLLLHVIGENGQEVDTIDFEEFAREFGPSIRAGLSACAWDAEIEGFDISVGGACPVQGEGMLDGCPVYFRARGESWSFCVSALPEGDAVKVGFGAAGYYLEGEYGSAFDAGWMIAEHSKVIVFACVAAVRKAQARRDRDGLPVPQQCVQLIVTGVPTGPEP